MPSTTRRQYEAIDLVKFVLSIFVVMAHIAPFGANEKYQTITRIIQVYCSRIPVPFFFIANGFFLFQNTAPGEFHWQKAKGFVLKIFKLYVIWTLLHLPLNVYGILTDENGILHAALGYIRNVLFLACYPQLWYLNAAMVGTLILSFFLHRKWKVRNILLLASFLYAIGLLGQSWFGLIRPIETAFPPLWTLLKLVQKMIYTTSNGLFEGFLFITIGMVIAQKPVEMKLPTAAAGLFVSYVLLIAEIWFVNAYHLTRPADIHIFLAPAGIFLFCTARAIRLKPNKIYLRLRQLSSLFFYMHMLIGDVLVLIFRYTAGIEIHNTGFKFALTMVVMFLVSMGIIHLSEHSKQFRFLKAIF